MAKRKSKRGRKKAEGKFVVLTSSCGSLKQAIAEYSERYATKEAAMAAATDVAAGGDYGDGVEAVFVVEIHETGKRTGNYVWA